MNNVAGAAKVLMTGALLGVSIQLQWGTGLDWFFGVLFVLALFLTSEILTFKQEA